jgi:hypothetical protein
LFTNQESLKAAKEQRTLEMTKTRKIAEFLGSQKNDFEVKR